MEATGSVYGKPNLPVQLTDVVCVGNEETLDSCMSNILTREEGQSAYSSVNAAGVDCAPSTPSNVLTVVSNNGPTVALGLFIVVLIISVLVSVG